jgi:hypothetical protein
MPVSGTTEWINVCRPPHGTVGTREKHGGIVALFEYFCEVIRGGRYDVREERLWALEPIYNYSIMN